MCNKLKNVIRTGWKTWNVERERVESVAEHIFGVQMLAIAMKSEYEYDIDIMKVVFMLAVHELGEIVIGDLTMFEISKEEKAKREKEAVHKILCGLLDGKEIENLFTEFNSHSTKEAMFAYQCECQTHYLTIRRHNRIQRDKITYLCRKCQGKLVFHSENS